MSDMIMNSTKLIDSFLNCLSCNACESKPNEILAYIDFILTAFWGAIQNLPRKFLSTPPNVAGPGIVDTADFFWDIASAENAQEANERAARGLYDRLLPGFGKHMMNPLVEEMLNFGKK